MKSRKRKIVLGSRVQPYPHNRKSIKGCVTYGSYSGEYIDLAEGLVHVLWDNGNTEWIEIAKVEVIG